LGFHDDSTSSCIVTREGVKVKTFHANMLKKYHIRESTTVQSDGANKSAVNEAAAVACVINDDDDAEGREGDE